VKAAITMRTALSDPALLGRALAGPSWEAWRAMLIAANGERLNAAEREVFQRFTSRQREPGQRIEEAEFLIGRRGGKDRAASVLATYLAAFVNWSDYTRLHRRRVCRLQNPVAAYRQPDGGHY